MVPRPVENSAPPHDPFEQLSGFVPGGFVGENVTVQLWWPRPGFMASRVVGHLDVAAARFLATSLQERVAEHAATRLVGFHDWARMTDYDGDARVLLTGVTRGMISRSDGIHLLVQSPLVAFGIRTASVVLTNVFVYSARAAFKLKLDSALRHVPQAPAKGQGAGELRTKACNGCGIELSDETGTAYSLINNGWRLSRPTGAQKPLWHCPACWRDQKKRTAP